jgi:hypothetical protein
MHNRMRICSESIANTVCLDQAASATIWLHASYTLSNCAAPCHGKQLSRPAPSDLQTRPVQAERPGVRLAPQAATASLPRACAGGHRLLRPPPTGPSHLQTVAGYLRLTMPPRPRPAKLHPAPGTCDLIRCAWPQPRPKPWRAADAMRRGACHVALPPRLTPSAHAFALRLLHSSCTRRGSSQ